MSDVVIRVEGVSKLYRLGEVGTGSLAHDVNRWWHRIRGKEDPYAMVGQTNDRTQAAGDSDYAWALKDISFEVQKGEVLGIIGRNGAGKSTLLKILSRVTTQSEGRIKVKGRIASLLEVGTGFHPDLTGRENIYLNGAILGMRKFEITRKLDEIVDFSGCARYLDTPVKRYSSGMKVRLGFAVAAHLEPEILIIDEVLAVGDAEFQKKCVGKMQDVAGHGRTILFVSHNMASIQHLCSRCILLKNGELAQDAGTNEVVQSHLKEMSMPEDEGAHIRSFDGKFSITHTILRNEAGQEGTSFRPGDTMVIEMHYDAQETIPEPYFWIAIASSGNTSLSASMLLDGVRPSCVEGRGFIRLKFRNLPLRPQNSYFVRAGMRYKDSKTLVFPTSEISFFNVIGSAMETGFHSPVADSFLGNSGGIDVPYEWEFSDGKRFAFNPLNR